MSEASIPVDLRNPGQVFACLGFLEAADVLLGDAFGWFDWGDPTNSEFHIHCDSSEHPFKVVLDFLLTAERRSVSPSEDIRERDGWNTITRSGVSSARLYNRAGKVQNALLPIELCSGGKALVFDYWANEGTGKVPLSLWTATNNNSARVRFEKLMAAAAEAAESQSRYWDDPMNTGAVVPANFRLELRRNWVSLDLGFSPDKVNKGPKCLHLSIVSYPFVELLAALGLSHARPARSRSNKFEWFYYPWADPLPPSLARAALSEPVFASQLHFIMLLEEPNDGGDLSISHAYEVSPNVYI
jgi:CRISPR-associated protein Csx14